MCLFLKFKQSFLPGLNSCQTAFAYSACSSNDNISILVVDFSGYKKNNAACNHFPISTSIIGKGETNERYLYWRI